MVVVDLPCAPAVEEGPVEPLHVRGELVAEIGHHPLPDPGGEVAGAEVEPAARERGDQHTYDGVRERAAEVLELLGRDRDQLLELLPGHVPEGGGVEDAVEDVVEGVLDQQREGGVDRAEAEHAGDGQREARPEVGAEVGEQAPVALHPRPPSSISSAIAAARPAAPPRPSRRRTSRRSSIMAAWRARCSSTARAAAAMRGPVAWRCRSSGTTSRPATMFGMPM